MTGNRRTRAGSPERPSPPTARDARTSWDRALDVWEDFQESGLDYSRDLVHGPALLRMLGRVDGLRVLDLGCGQGRFTRAIARRGARVTAVDWSSAMIRSARAHERAEPLGIDYRRLDAAQVGSTFPAGRFDRIVACMSLMDMPALSRVLRGARRVVRPEGRLVFSVSHPVNTSEVGWERRSDPVSGGVVLDHYFDQRVGWTEWRMPRLMRPFDTVYWHRTFEDWYALLRSTGFEVEAIAEPRATAAQVRRRPVLAGCRRVPFFLVVGCRPVPLARRAAAARRRTAQN